ncbi:hypothetical protein M9458_028311, partial [Cirrhinus mrigala]
LLHPSGSTLALCRSSSTMAFCIPALPRPLEPSAPVWPSGSSASPCLVGSPSLPRAPPPPDLSPLVGPLESSALLPPWLLPTSAP